MSNFDCWFSDLASTYRRLDIDVSVSERMSLSISLALDKTDIKNMPLMDDLLSGLQNIPSQLVLKQGSAEDIYSQVEQLVVSTCKDKFVKFTKIALVIKHPPFTYSARLIV